MYLYRSRIVTQIDCKIVIIIIHSPAIKPNPNYHYILYNLYKAQIYLKNKS